MPGCVSESHKVGGPRNSRVRENCCINSNRPSSRRLDRCDRVIQNESRDPFGGNVYYVTMQITFPTRKFRYGERNFHCDVVHITTKWVSSLTPDCNGVFAIKAYNRDVARRLISVRWLGDNWGVILPMRQEPVH